MNFLRKLFPQIQKKKSMAQDVNDSNNLRTTELTDVEFPSQIDMVSNLTFENNVILNIDDYTDNDSSITHTINCDETDSNKILCTLENVAPIVIRPSNSDKVPDTIEINGDVVSEEAFTLNESPFIGGNSPVNTVVNSETSQHFSVTDKDTKQLEVPDDLIHREIVFNHISLINDANTIENGIDNETLQNLREFEETLNKFNKTACLNNDSGEELINLDEFNYIFDNLDSMNKDSQNNSIKDTNNNLTNSEINLSNIKNDDIISISSSTEDEKCQAGDMQDEIFINSGSEDLQNSDCDGYNSSDFEFISETEAKMDGLIINFRQNNSVKHDNLSRAELSTFSSQFRQMEKEDDTKKEVSDPGEGPSGLNKLRNEFQDRSYRNNHAIPVGDDYFRLFQGIYNPLLPACEIYFMENKSVRASAMNVQYDGMGFDKQLALRRPQPDSSEDEFEDAAKACAKKILNTYPGENRKRRRR